MKLLLAVLGSLLVLSVTAANDVCYQKICKDADNAKCDALLLATVANPELPNFAKANFYESFNYLLLAMNFDSHLRDRPGFSKLFREQSDKLYDNAVKMIKHMTTRGFEVDFRSGGIDFERTAGVFLSLKEAEALAKALQIEKKLATKSIDLWKKTDDAEFKHFVQEEFLEDQIKSVRKFSGYANDVLKFRKDDSYSLAVYLFDEYLQKQ